MNGRFMTRDIRGREGEGRPRPGGGCAGRSRDAPPRRLPRPLRGLRATPVADARGDSRGHPRLLLPGKRWPAREGRCPVLRRLGGRSRGGVGSRTAPAGGGGRGAAPPGRVFLPRRKATRRGASRGAIVRVTF